MDGWKFTEVITTLREYQTLLDHMSVLLISSACVLAFKNRRLKTRTGALCLSIGAFMLAVANLVLGFNFRSKLVDIIPSLDLQKNPSSYTDPCLKSLALWQIGLLSLGAALLIFSAYRTPRDRKSNAS